MLLLVIIDNINAAYSEYSFLSANCALRMSEFTEKLTDFNFTQ